MFHRHILRCIRSLQKRMPRQVRRSFRSRRTESLSIEVFEQRILLAGRGVAFFVNGWTGESIPETVSEELNDMALRSSLAWDNENGGTGDGFLDIYETNWNSPNPRSESGNPGGFIANSFNDLFEPINVNVFGKHVPVGVQFKGIIDQPEPALPNQFISALTTILNTEYDDDDFVALIGHSLGGNSILRVASNALLTTGIDLLATLDPVGWSFNPDASELFEREIIPEITFDNPFFDLPIPIGDESYTVFPGLSVGIDVTALSAIVAAGTFDPLRGVMGYRNELPSPGSNVDLFYNRWQNGYFFPFDFDNSGELDASRVQDTVERFSYDGFTIQEQTPRNQMRDEDFNEIEQTPDFFDFLFEHSDFSFEFEADFGSITSPNFPPDITFDFGLNPTSALSHGALPNDPYIQQELIAVLEAIVPQPPIAVAGVVPIGRSFREGDFITLTATGSTDPNPDDTLRYRWRQIQGPFVTLSDPTALNPTFLATDDTFLDDSTLRFALTVTDDTGASDTAIVSLTVDNVPPVLSPIIGPDVFVRACPAIFAVPFQDPGSADILSNSWDFGDGTVTPFVTLSGTTGVAVSPLHSYRDTGTFTIRSRVRDDDATAVARKDVPILPAGLFPDANDPSKTALYVGGSVESETITLRRLMNGRIQVVMPDFVGDFEAPTGHIYVNASNGNDIILLDFSNGSFLSSSGAVIDGATGTDTLAVRNGGTITYTPDATGLADRGILAVGGSSIRFSHAEIVTPVAPDITAVTLNSASIDENGTVTLSGSFVDAGSLSTHTIEINWGDTGSPDSIQTVNLSATPTATKTFMVTHTYLDDHPVSGTAFDVLPISVTVTDNDDLPDSQSTEVTVNNVDPTINSISLSVTSINEGQSVTVSGTFSDPALGIATESFTGTALWSDGSVTAVTVDGTNGTFTSTRAFPDDHPMTGTAFDEFTVDITITDDDTGADTATSSVLTVNNVDPVILDFASDASFADKAEEGEAVNIVANFTDVGVLDTHVAEIDWGDGTVEPATVTPGLPGTGTVASAHAYAAGGIFTITVTLTDDDTGTATADAMAVVTGVGLNDGILYIIGTSVDDRVKIDRKGHDKLEVKASFIPDHHRLFHATAVDKIVSYLCEGEDHADISTWVTTPAIIHGGADADHLHGGGGPTVLLGDDGNDKLVGGRGRNILIGGTGLDKLYGHKESDVLIGGSTTSDDDDDALMAMAMAWATDDSYENLVLAVDALLTVIDDGEVDRLTGGLGVDLFYDGVRDKLIGVKHIEVVI